MELSSHRAVRTTLFILLNNLYHEVEGTLSHEIRTAFLNLNILGKTPPKLATALPS